MKLTGENRRTRGKTWPSATLSTTNPTWTDPGSNPGLRDGRPAANRLSHGTASLTVTVASICLRFYIRSKSQPVHLYRFRHHSPGTNCVSIAALLLQFVDKRMRHNSFAVRTYTNLFTLPVFLWTGIPKPSVATQFGSELPKRRRECGRSNTVTSRYGTIWVVRPAWFTILGGGRTVRRALQ
jgi:hypothetical protein